jgi:hypothetical protein
MSHWRKNHQSDSNHLKSVDLYDEKESARTGKDKYLSPVVVIERMAVDVIKSKDKPKGEKRNFAYFQGKSKPLGLNVTNCETIADLAGSPATERWVGLAIQLYVDPHARYPGGKKGPAIRIRPTAPDGKPDTAPLPELSEEARDRLEEEHAGRLKEREPGEEG